MADREPPYDPYIPSSNNGAGGGRDAAGNSRTAVLQAQIDDTVGVMRENINKVAERGDKIHSLEGKADNLVRSTREFRRGANRVRKDMWWKDMKMRICLVVGIIILLTLIIVPIVVTKH